MTIATCEGATCLSVDVKAHPWLFKIRRRVVIVLSDLNRPSHPDGHADGEEQREQINNPVDGREALAHGVDQKSENNEQDSLNDGPDQQCFLVPLVGFVFSRQRIQQKKNRARNKYSAESMSLLNHSGGV